MSLDCIFKPKSVAILGASSRKEKAGYKFAKAVLDAGYVGQLFFTNPRGGEVFGRPIYKSLADIKQEIDLALVQVARENIIEVLEDSEAAGVKALVLYTAGFGEADEQGARLQEELIKFTKRTRIRVVGPNCQGIFSASVGLDLTGSGTIPSGNIGMISQSGGLGAHAWYEATNNLRVGFSKFVSIGNQVDIPIHEYLEYMGDDPETQAIVLYIEGLKSGTGRAFVEVARKVALKKPIVAVKGGQTKSGQRAANSHTGSLVGAPAVMSAAFREAGVIEVSSFEDLLPVAQTLLLCQPLKSDKIALVGFGGGHSTLSADAVERAGFEIPTFSPKTDARLRELLPYWAPRKNPIDLAGGYLNDLTVWIRTMRTALEEDDIGGALIYGPWAAFLPDLKTGDTDWKDVTRQMAALQNEYGKPIVACSHTGRGGIYQNDELRAGGVPVFDRINTAVAALSALRQRSEWLTNNRGHTTTVVDDKNLAKPVLPQDAANLTEPEAYALLGEASIPVAPFKVATSPGEAADAAARLGYPVVMKICSRDIVHKSDVRGVATGVASDPEAEATFIELRERARKAGANDAAILVAKQVSGLELIVGFVRDPHFGPTAMVGLGGIFVEVLKDVAIRLAPVSHDEAKNMLAELKASPLLFGARSQTPLNTDAIAEIIVRVSRLGAAADAINEIDLNPVFVTPEGAQAADARVILRQAQ